MRKSITWRSIGAAAGRSRRMRGLSIDSAIARGGSPHDQHSHDPPARLQDPCNNDRVIVAFGG
jgi:hypothetical protein